MQSRNSEFFGPLSTSLRRGAPESAEEAMTPRSQLLYLEDDLADVELLQGALQEDGLACDITRVDTECGFLAALQQDGFDLILADYPLPSFDGLSALRMARRQKPDLPFIFVSGTMGEETAIEVLKTGATD